MMTAKELCEEVYGLSGFESTGSFQGSVDPDDRMIFFLLRQAVRDIGKYKWNELIKSGLISVTTNDLEYDLPADFREFIPGSMRVKDDVRWVDFPTSFSEWARVDSNIGPVGIEHRLQIRDNKVVKLAQDTSSWDMRFDYISNHPVMGGVSQNEGQKTVQLDTDLVLLDEDLMVKALKAKWSIEKGLDTLQADVMGFESYLRLMQGSTMTAQKLRFVAPPNYYPAPPYTNTWKG